MLWWKVGNSPATWPRELGSLFTPYIQLRSGQCSHEVDEPPGEFWVATSTPFAVYLPVVSWEVEVPTYPDVAVAFEARL